MSVLLDIAVRCEVSGRGCSRQAIGARDERERPGVVASVEVDLSEGEGVFAGVCTISAPLLR